MSEPEKPLSSTERLPDIYSPKNQNSSRQSIAKRNQIIDDYLKSLDQGNNNKQNDSSSEEDDKDPFSSKNIKNLKPLKKPKNRLILPNFQKREKLKSESNSRNNKNKSMPKNITNDNFIKKNKKMQKNKNFSENNIMNKLIDVKTIHTEKLLEINNVNHNLNSKWTKNCISTYNNFINLKKNKKNLNYIQYKKKNEVKVNHLNNINNTLMQQIRSKSHIKQSFELYKDKIMLKKNNINKTISGNNKLNMKGKNLTQIGIIIPYNNAGVNNLYNNTFKIERSKRRNFTAKMIQTKISIKKNKKFNNYRINSTSNNHRAIENKHQTYEKLIQEKSNPYGLYWINKILRKNAKEKVGVSKEFINGVPVVRLMGKESISKREIKRRLSEIEQRKKMEENKYNKIINAEAKLNKNDLEEEYNLPKNILEQFNKNRKNFFKLRKDIIEEPNEED